MKKPKTNKNTGNRSPLTETPGSRTWREMYPTPDCVDWHEDAEGDPCIMETGIRYRDAETEDVGGAEIYVWRDRDGKFSLQHRHLNDVARQHGGCDWTDEGSTWEEIMAALAIYALPIPRKRSGD